MLPIVSPNSFPSLPWCFSNPFTVTLGVPKSSARKKGHFPPVNTGGRGRGAQSAGAHQLEVPPPKQQCPPHPTPRKLSSPPDFSCPGLKILPGEDRLEGLCPSQCQLVSRHAEPVPGISGEDQGRWLDQTALLQVQQRPHPRAQAPIRVSRDLR